MPLRRFFSCLNYKKSRDKQLISLVQCLQICFQVSSSFDFYSLMLTRLLLHIQNHYHWDMQGKKKYKMNADLTTVLLIKEKNFPGSPLSNHFYLQAMIQKCDLWLPVAGKAAEKSWQGKRKRKWVLRLSTKKTCTSNCSDIPNIWLLQELLLIIELLC